MLTGAYVPTFSLPTQIPFSFPDGITSSSALTSWFAYNFF